MERRESGVRQPRPRLDGDLPRPRAAGEIDDPYGDVFLVVDGWSTLQAGLRDLETRFKELASRGLSFGVHVIVSATRWSEMRTWLRDLLGTRLELRLADSMESEVGSRKAATVPNQPGRGLTTGGCTSCPRCRGWTAVRRPTTWPRRPSPPSRRSATFWTGRRHRASGCSPPSCRRRAAGAGTGLQGLHRPRRATTGPGLARLHGHPAPAGLRRQRDRQVQRAPAGPAGHQRHYTPEQAKVVLGDSAPRPRHRHDHRLPGRIRVHRRQAPRAGGQPPCR